MKNLFRLLSILAALLLNPAVHAEPTHSMLGNACAGCHGTRGHSSSPMPIIAGLSRQYLRRTLLEFKNDKRPSTVMGRIAKGYSDDEIDALAAYFASQEWISPPQQANLDPKLIKRGEKIHKNGCKVCHKQDGRHQDDKVPRLAGQWREYLEIVFEEYWRPERRMPSLFMSIAIRQLDDEDREALAQFYASQR